MNKLSEIFKKNKISENKAVIPYIMVGDGGLDESYRLLDLYVLSGVKIIEIGVPFSDSTADGITIQQASKRALDNNISLGKVLEFISTASLKYSEVAFVMMTYLNPIVNHGIEVFFSDLNKAGCCGIIIPDLPIEEYDLIYKYTLDNKIAIIPLISLNTESSRIKTILSKSSGFVYAVTLNGITGTKSADEDLVSNLHEKIAQSTDLPIVAGFGIKNRQQIRRLTKTFDAVVVASQLIKLAQEKKYEDMADLVRCTE